MDKRAAKTRSLVPPASHRIVAPTSLGGTAITLTEEAYPRLEEMIVTLELEPGSVVSEAILSKHLGIGTTPIREALQRLAREHLVQIMPRRGVVVTGIDVRQQLQVLETRRELDRLIAQSAARRATAAERQAFLELAEGMARAAAAGDIRSFLRCHGNFSKLAAKAARNEIAAGIAEALHAVSRRFWFFHHRDFPDWDETARLHVAAARAIAAGDEAEAATTSDELIPTLSGQPTSSSTSPPTPSPTPRPSSTVGTAT